MKKSQYYKLEYLDHSDKYISNQPMESSFQQLSQLHQSNALSNTEKVLPRKCVFACDPGAVLICHQDIFYLPETHGWARVTWAPRTLAAQRWEREEAVLTRSRDASPTVRLNLEGGFLAFNRAQW